MLLPNSFRSDRIAASTSNGITGFEDICPMLQIRRCKRTVACLAAALCLLGRAGRFNDAGISDGAACSAADKKAGAPEKKGASGSFVPPPLSELDAKADWIDQPVKDTLQMLREYQAGAKPLVTAAQALALRNTSRQDNDRIIGALGRVATNDADVDYGATIN